LKVGLSQSIILKNIRQAMNARFIELEKYIYRVLKLVKELKY